MKLAIYNGSPRGKSSNSAKIAELLADNFNTSEILIHYISKPENHETAILNDADSYFIVFPLYADAMPFSVKLMFEEMDKNKDVYKNKPIYFFVHSGFPEAKQSRLLERYLRYFCKLIEARCMGVAIMGNSEGLRRMKDSSKRLQRIKENLVIFADDISKSKPYSKNSLQFFSGMETMPKFVLFLLKSMPGIFNKVFDFMFKQNGAYDKRFNKPYA